MVRHVVFRIAVFIRRDSDRCQKGLNSECLHAAAAATPLQLRSNRDRERARPPQGSWVQVYAQAQALDEADRLRTTAVCAPIDVYTISNDRLTPSKPDHIHTEPYGAPAGAHPPGGLDGDLAAIDRLLEEDPALLNAQVEYAVRMDGCFVHGWTPLLLAAWRGTMRWWRACWTLART